MGGESQTFREHCERARSLLGAGQYDAAVSEYQGAMGIDANSPDVYYGLGTAFFLKGDLQRAVDAFQEVVHLDPGRGSAYVNMGAAYNRLDRTDKAIECLLEAVKLSPPIAEAYYNLGIAYRRSNQPMRAVDAYREATKLAPNMADAHFNLANLYLAMRRHREAVVHYKRALAARPDFTRAADALAQAEAEQARAAAELANTEGRVVAAGEHDTAAILEKPSGRDRLVVQSRLREVVVNCVRFSGEYAVYLENVLEPAVQRLSRCLLHADSAPDEVEESAAAFEQALSDGRLIYKSLTGTVSAMRRTAMELTGGQ